MSNPSYPYVDLKGVLDIQKNYLSSLQSSDPNSSAMIGSIQTNLSNMYTNYAQSNPSTDASIVHQKELLDIVNTEKQRLMDKKQSVDNVIYGKKRAVELNDSNRLRQNRYTNLLVIMTIVLALFAGIMVMSMYLTFIPQVVFDILSIIVISVGIYISVYTFLDIQSRDKMNFNHLDLPSLPNKNAGNTMAKGSGSVTDLLFGLQGCVAEQCCGPNTFYDQGNGVCVPLSLKAFTTMSFAYKTGELPTSGKIQYDGAYEFDKYVPVQ